MRTVVRHQRRGAGVELELPGRGVTWDEAVRDFLAEKRAENCSPATVDKICAWVLLGRAKEFVAEEERLILRAAYQLSGRDGVMLELMLRTGVRVSEVCNLTLDDIWDEKDVAVPFIRVRQGKGRKDRIVPLDSPRYALSKRLREYIAKERPKATRLRWLFLTHRNKGAAATTR